MDGTQRYCLTDDDIRYEYRVMLRWCHLFQRTAAEWVELEAKRFRERHPVVGIRTYNVRSDPRHSEAA